jgi:hypothetical protein
MNPVSFHNRLATTVLLYMIILCLWGFWHAIRKEDLNGSYWGAVVIAEMVILIQGAIGIYLFVVGLQPGRGGMHILYGIVGAIGIPAVYIFTKGKSDQRAMLVYAAVMLFNSGIFLRSMATG